MASTQRVAIVSAAVAAVLSVSLTLAVVAATRPPTFVTLPSASTSAAPQSGILTSGSATVSKKPDLATVTAGVQSEASSAAGAQADLASKAAKLISRIKTLGVPDKDLSTAGYWVGPIYDQTGRSVSGYRANEQLIVKWHTVDNVGKALDAIVQEGGATNLSVGFGLADPKAAQAEARSAAIQDARSRAEAMATAAGARLGPVVRVVDLSASSRPPGQLDFGAASAAPTTQVPVGQVDVQVTVEVDYALG